MFKKIAIASIIATSSILMSGCSTNHYSGSEYKSAQAMQAMNVYIGKVKSVRRVQINGINTGAGLVGGAALAATAGSLLGGGTGQIVSQVLFGVVGAVLGAKAEGSLSEHEGVEFVVLLGNSKMIAVTQVDNMNIAKGDLVNVIVSSSDVRIAPMN